MVNVISFTKNGHKLNKQLCQALENCQGFTTDKEKQNYIEVKTFAEISFKEGRDMVFIGATGIAVRSIAPFIQNKFVDPAVIVVDEGGDFVIPLLSGHVGGGNILGKKIGQILNATTVITTATDINGLFAVDVFAVNNNLVIKEKDVAKEISASILSGEKVCFNSKISILGNIPQEIKEEALGNIGFVISPYKEDLYKKTLHLVPKNVVLGIGCKRDTPQEYIENAVLIAIKNANIDVLALKKVCTIDVKKHEKGLVDFCEKYKLPLGIYTAQELMTAEGTFTASDFVISVTGADNVCERSAVLGSGINGKLIAKKESVNGVTTAICLEEGSITFE